VTELPHIPLLRAGGRLRDIPVAAIHAARRNPRTDAAAALDGLTASLTAGMVQYPIVVAVSDDTFELIDGERRWRGAQAAGIAEITCLVCEGGTPSATLFTQIIANLHRQDLGPLDESAALKAAWLVLNAQELNLGAQADAILGAAQGLSEVLVPLRRLLDDAGWKYYVPTVSQAIFIESLGLGMSAAVMKKKLQVLAATEEIQDVARTHRLTAASIRALMTLEPEQQATLLQAIDAAPPIAKLVRAIVQGVKQKGRAIGDAIAIAQGRLPGDESPPSHAAVSPVSSRDGRARSDDGAMGTPDADEPHPSSAEPLDEMAVMDAVLPIIDTAQHIKRQVGALLALAGGDPSRIPEPWGEYAQDAIGMIRTSIGTFLPRIVATKE
jgi:ParB-like chromosome segregation protein Spo0J